MTTGNDAASFTEITSAAPPVDETIIEQAAPVVEKAATVVESPVAKQPDNDRVPVSELIAERKARQDAARRYDEVMAEMAILRRERQQEAEAVKPKPKPDLFEDPNAFIREQMDPQFNRANAIAMHNAQLIAETRYGEDKVKSAQEAFDGLVRSGQIHPADQARVLNALNPFAEAVKWHKERSVRETVGDDVDAFKAKLRSELLADPEFRKEADAAWRTQAQATPGVIRPAVPSTPSLSRVGASALAAAAADDEDDASAFASITARKRSK